MTNHHNVRFPATLNNIVILFLNQGCNAKCSVALCFEGVIGECCFGGTFSEGSL